MSQAAVCRRDARREANKRRGDGLCSAASLNARDGRRKRESMPDKSRAVGPGPRAGTVRDEAGEILDIPVGWVLLQPGDAALTGRVKRAGPVWTVHEKRGRKLFSRGLYAAAERIESIRMQLAEERQNPAHARKL
jgi:hypothetical protein